MNWPGILLSLMCILPLMLQKAESAKSCGPPKRCAYGQFYPDACDCTKFYQCNNGRAGQRQCAESFAFHPDLLGCEPKEDVMSCKGYQKKTKYCGPPKRCSQGQYYPDACDCAKFYYCHTNGIIHMQCESDSHFDPVVRACDFKDNVMCQDDQDVKDKLIASKSSGINDEPLSKTVENVRSYQSADPPKPTGNNKTPVDQSFNEDLLSFHNKYRSKHGVPPLTFNKTTADYAQHWAEYLVTIPNLKHRDHGLKAYGENLYSGWEDPKGKDVVGLWYDEIKDYPGYGAEPPKDNDLFMKYGHFSQVVWKDTRQLGCGKATKDKRTVVVCNYYPFGNVGGTYAKNVLPPKN